MNKKLSILALFAILILACDDSSNADNAASESGLVGSDVDTTLPACEKASQGSVDDESSVSWSEMPLDTVPWQKSDTVCLYNDFPYKDTICCFGEREHGYNVMKMVNISM